MKIIFTVIKNIWYICVRILLISKGSFSSSLVRSFVRMFRHFLTGLCTYFYLFLHRFVNFSFNIEKNLWMLGKKKLSDWTKSMSTRWHFKSYDMLCSLFINSRLSKMTGVIYMSLLVKNQHICAFWLEWKLTPQHFCTGSV